MRLRTFSLHPARSATTVPTSPLDRTTRDFNFDNLIISRPPHRWRHKLEQSPHSTSIPLLKSPTSTTISPPAHLTAHKTSFDSLISTTHPIAHESCSDSPIIACHLHCWHIHCFILIYAVPSLIFFHIATIFTAGSDIATAYLPFFYHRFRLSKITNITFCRPLPAKSEPGSPAYIRTHGYARYTVAETFSALKQCWTWLFIIWLRSEFWFPISSHLNIEEGSYLQWVFLPHFYGKLYSLAMHQTSPQCCTHVPRNFILFWSPPFPNYLKRTPPLIRPKPFQVHSTIATLTVSRFLKVLASLHVMAWIFSSAIRKRT